MQTFFAFFLIKSNKNAFLRVFSRFSDYSLYLCIAKKYTNKAVYTHYYYIIKKTIKKSEWKLRTNL